MESEETTEIGKKQLVGCYAPWLKDVIFSVTNMDVEFNGPF